jgi:hypothetical protein
MLVHNRSLAPHARKRLLSPLCIQSSVLPIDTIHVQSLLTLRLSLLDSYLLGVHVRAVEDGTRVSRIRRLLGDEVRDLFGLQFLGRGVVLRSDAAEESGLSDAGLFEVGVYFSADFVACICSVSATSFYTQLHRSILR